MGKGEAVGWVIAGHRAPSKIFTISSSAVSPSSHSTKKDSERGFGRSLMFGCGACRSACWAS